LEVGSLRDLVGLLQLVERGGELRLVLGAVLSAVMSRSMIASANFLGLRRPGGGRTPADREACQ
jgi:hypothetical protein